MTRSKKIPLRCWKVQSWDGNCLRYLSLDEIDRMLEKIDLSKPEGRRNKAMLEVLIQLWSQGILSWWI